MNFCWHKWSKWSDPIPTYENGHKQQWAHCENCNKAKFRSLSWDKQAPLSAVLNALKETKGETK